MARLKRDERVCPYCAETIKAAATRCRYCQSDLKPLESGPPEPRREAELESGPTVERPADRPRWTAPSWQDALSFVQLNLTVVLAALVLLAGVGVGVAWWRAEQASSSTAPDGSLVGEDARTEVLVTAADLTERTLSYDYKTLANDMEEARARMTPSFRKQYDDTMAQVRANTEKNKIVLEATVVSPAIIEATEHRAKVLAFVNQTTTAGTGKKANRQLSQNSLVVTLVREEGDWDMSNVTAVG